MKNILYIVLIMLFFTSCEKYVTEKSDLTLSGKYVVSRLDITNVDQAQTRDSLYIIGSTYINKALPNPFDSITVNRFYLYFDYVTIKLKLNGVSQSGSDIWEYGSSPNEIFYRILNNNSYSNGYIQFDYLTKDGSSRTVTFLIEDDGFESLQLKSSGGWFNGKFGQKQVMTMYLSRLGP